MMAPEAAKTGRPAGGSMRSGFLRLMFSQVLLKMLGLGREAVIAFFFKVSAASNYYFMIRGINESMLSVISGNTLGGVFIPRMSHDEQGRVRFSEIRKLTRFGWIVGGLLALITMPLQFYFFFRRGAAFQEFHTDLLWVIFWLGICIIFISYNAFAGVLLQSVGDFRALSNLSLIIGFGLMAGPLICRNAFGFSGITLARLLTLLLGAAYLAWALRRVRDRFSPL
ncbi:MAG TPA: hypothetical protein VL181_01630, partial [Holophagaceae bacterium]|nr:hypothetical protein [Holophagaceae bacterium]